MSSFSIDSILALQESKCGAPQGNDMRKNISSLSLEELRDQEITTSKCGDRKRSPNSSPALATEQSSYEGIVLANFYCIFHAFIFSCHFNSIFSYVCRLKSQNHYILLTGYLNCALSTSARATCNRKFNVLDFVFSQGEPWLALLQLHCA